LKVTELLDEVRGVRRAVEMLDHPQPLVVTVDKIFRGRGRNKETK
jgi:hypothetical protein